MNTDMNTDMDKDMAMDMDDYKTGEFCRNLRGINGGAFKHENS
jgi:hypothetical protein